MTIIFFKNLLKCLPSSAISAPDHPRLLPHPATANTSAASTITKNFNSLYDISSASTSKSRSSPSDSRSFSPSDSDSDPDFAAAVASQRFFFSSPGRSNSILESPIGGGIAVKKLSPDPYADFRDSMREMIEARKVRDVRTDWEFLQELLCCYLNLNPKQTHKIIISAFSDIVVCLLSESGRRRL